MKLMGVCICVQSILAESHTVAVTHATTKKLPKPPDFFNEKSYISSRQKT